MKGVVYFDRLEYEKINQLRKVIGKGEMAWNNRLIKSLPQETKNEISAIVFGEVCNFKVEVEQNAATGFPIPVFIEV